MNELRRTLIAVLSLQAGQWGGRAAAQSAGTARVLPVPLTVFANVFGDDEAKAVAAVTRIANPSLSFGTTTLNGISNLGQYCGEYGTTFV